MSVRWYSVASIRTSNRLKSRLVGQLVSLWCVWRAMRSNTRLCTVSWKGVEEVGVDIYEGMPFVYIYRVVIKDSDKDGW